VPYDLDSTSVSGRWSVVSSNRRRPEPSTIGRRFVLAATVRLAGDLDVAEECVQEAFVAALTTWSQRGIPANPGAWLTATARRRALDALRRDQRLRHKLPLLVGTDAAASDPLEWAGEGEEAGVSQLPDDRLRLIFTCCHPALAREAQVALTLRLVCGLTTPEIARAFLVSEPTMAARITRAKKKITLARIPYRVPPAHDLPDRLDAVLTVAHLLYTTGHTAPAGDQLVRADLVERALDLARMLYILMPDDREVRGLLALLLLTDARRATRTAADGRLLLLEEQDRSRWDRQAIGEGRQLVDQALRRGRPGRFTLQAATATLHAEAPATPTPTGRRCSACTTCCWRCGPHRWWCSTARSPSPWSRARRPGWPPWTRSPTTPTLRPTPTWPPPAPTCCAASAEAVTPPRPTEPRSPWPATPQSRTSSPDASPSSPLPEDRSTARSVGWDTRKPASSWKGSAG
jgi:RNA polymerase sigma-70 factor, ECF subfamily